jgi:hypothetical protein
MQCANPPREWRKFRDLSSKSGKRGAGHGSPIGATPGAFREIRSPLWPIARHREREQEVNFMVETG